MPSVGIKMDFILAFWCMSKKHNRNWITDSAFFLFSQVTRTVADRNSETVELRASISAAYACPRVLIPTSQALSTKKPSAAAAPSMLPDCLCYLSFIWKETVHCETVPVWKKKPTTGGVCIKSTLLIQTKMRQ